MISNSMKLYDCEYEGNTWINKFSNLSRFIHFKDTFRGSPCTLVPFKYKDTVNLFYYYNISSPTSLNCSLTRYNPSKNFSSYFQNYSSLLDFNATVSIFYFIGFRLWASQISWCKVTYNHTCYGNLWVRSRL